MLAASRGHADCVVALLEYGASVTAHTKAHDTAVVFAIEHNHVECVEPIVRAMEEQKVPPAYIDLLSRLYDGQTATVQCDCRSREFGIQKGTKQGDPISPASFNAVLEIVMRRWKDK